MDIRKLDARGAVAVAYAAVPSVMWEFADPHKSSKTKKLLNTKLRKYCPGCNQANTLRSIEPTEANMHNCFKCSSCGHLCKAPKSLLPKGPNQSSSRVSSVDPSTRLAKAMEASEVMHAVESQPAELRLWLLWVYTDPDPVEQGRMEGLLLAVLIGLLDEVELKNLQGLKASADAIRVISMAMKSFRHRMRCEKSLYKHSDYAQAIDRDRAQFTGTRLWARVLREVDATMKVLDRNAIEPVNELVGRWFDQDNPD